MRSVRLLPFQVHEVINYTDEMPYGVKMVNAPKMWETGIKGKGVVVAVIDTGCDFNHPDLQDRIIGGYNFTTDYQGDTKNFYDNNGHGTHVAGIIAANMNNSGIVGVAPEASLLILKGLTEYGTGDYENIIRSIDYAIKWRGPKGEPVRVISMSLGSSENVSELHESIKRAVNNNVLVVCSAGNDGDGGTDTIELQYPGCYQEVVEVGAVDCNKKLAYFSSSNPQVDLVAPGVDILSTFTNGKYATFSGTSMATPYVAGAAALLLDHYEKRENGKLPTEAEIFTELCRNTIPIGCGKNGEGHGLLNLNHD